MRARFAEEHNEGLRFANERFRDVSVRVRDARNTVEKKFKALAAARKAYVDLYEAALFGGHIRDTGNNPAGQQVLAMAGQPGSQPCWSLTVIQPGTYPSQIRI